ncbi:MAG: glucose-6-phosphate isomerase [Clostridiales Family XIII bacterium]|jgi:glucose-6-phosphate isomerase|nr:glucose-6-phosphate isomerase [Clostridiales Family XIII bacterium]
MANSFNWNKAFTLDFSLIDGFSKNAESSKRFLSKVKSMYSDKKAAEKILKKIDPLIYEFYELGVPEDDSGDLAFGTSIVYPGKIGKEFYMTKGHFHTIIGTAEVYYCLAGKGGMMMENPEGDVIYKELTPGTALYVPKRYAHRSVNTGQEKLITFFTFRADAGHDYGSIEKKGFRKLVLSSENDDRDYEIVDNPKWKGE